MPVPESEPQLPPTDGNDGPASSPATTPARSHGGHHGYRASRRRVWTLMCIGLSAGSYTDCCNRQFIAGSILRDDQNQRRQVLAVESDSELILHVSPPDVATTPPAATEENPNPVVPVWPAGVGEHAPGQG